MKRSSLLWTLPLCGILLGQVWAQEATKADDKKKETPPPSEKSENAKKDDSWTLEKLFSRRGFTGTTATGMAFSHDGRYAAYLWKPYVDRLEGNDLYLLDVASGKAERVTSLAMMTRFQASARAAKEARERRASSGDEGADNDRRDDQQQEQQQQERQRGGGGQNQQRAGRYAGVSGFTWSPIENELIFTSEGDLYRWKIGMKEPIRLTATRTNESSVQYLPDGSGFIYMRDGALMRWRFSRDREEQLDPRFGPQGFAGGGRGFGQRRQQDQQQQEQQQDGAQGPPTESLSTYKLSPDGKRLVLTTRKRVPGEKPDPNRKVNIATYRERFMTVREVPREVTEDQPPIFETTVYFYEIGDPFLENGVLSTLFTFKATTPRDMISTPDWASDSRHATWATFTYTNREVQVHSAVIADAPGKDKAATAKLVSKFTHNGGPTTPPMIQPRYIDDNRRIVLLTEQSGFRQLHLLDPAYESMEQLTNGKYEVYPLDLSKDRKNYYLTATKEDSACRDIYRYNFADRSLTRISKERGVYDAVVVSPDGKNLLTNYVCFGKPRELYLLAADGAQKALTSSHPDLAKTLMAERPEFFTYVNRNGQEIHAHLFKPPGWKKEDKRPLLIYVYGGPLGTSKNVVEGAYQSDGYYFAAYMAKKYGYVTCTIDPRGMSGYGAVFEKANFEQVGKPQVEDLVDGVKFMVENCGVDPKRVGIHGWSFGGFQTQMCMYSAPDVFAVGIAGAGPTEWENYNSWYSSATIGPSRPGLPDLSKYSLLPLAKNLKGKLLLLHGMEDSNVLYQDTVRVYRELLKAGKGTQVELFLDPTGGHGLGGDIDRLQKAKKYEEFLVRTLGRYEPPQVTSVPANTPTSEMRPEAKKADVTKPAETKAEEKSHEAKSKDEKKGG